MPQSKAPQGFIGLKGLGHLKDLLFCMGEI